MKTINKLINCSLLIINCSLFSCGEPLMQYDVNTATPVVESYLQEGSAALTVKVYSMEVYLQDGYDLSDPISGLSPSVNGRLLTETSSGVYSLDLGDDTLRAGQQFDLLFDYNGTTVSASATVPAPVQNLRVEPEALTIDLSSWTVGGEADTTGVTLSWDDPGGDYYQIYIESPNTSSIPSLGIFGRRMMQPFKGNTVRVSAMEFRSSGYHFIYVYRVGRDYAELYEQSSASDLANPVSFINNAFGIFTAMSSGKTRVYVAEEAEE